MFIGWVKSQKARQELKSGSVQVNHNILGRHFVYLPRRLWQQDKLKKEEAGITYMRYDFELRQRQQELKGQIKNTFLRWNVEV